ncbi:hypothetical protein CPB97_003085 [Podila verticillata]|nr:hypothetical protein CPB97_003085 [Podila verticillata]
MSSPLMLHNSMTNNCISLLCLVDGEPTSNPFFIKIPLNNNVAQLKDLIKTKKTNYFSDIDADNLTLWRVFIKITEDNESRILLNDVASDKKKLHPTDGISEVFQVQPPQKRVHIIVQRPPQAQSFPISGYNPQKRLFDGELEWLCNKKQRVCLAEGWKEYTAFDGTIVHLPPLLIDILASNEFAAEPRTAFDHLKDDINLQAGHAINMPSLGQTPKHFVDGDINHRFFITVQMLELWDEMRHDTRTTYRRVLSGPMGVSKSYLSYFLAAKAYVEKWLVLYISDAGLLDRDDENESALLLVKRFLALNKDILTGIELKMLVNDYDGTRDISRNALSVIFGTLLMTRERKTLLLVDEHGKLFQRDPYVPEKFKSLNPLSSYHWWGEDTNGSRLIFTGTAHGKFEMTIMDESYRATSVVFVSPLSRNVFSNLLDTYPWLQAATIEREVTQITNCVPRELVNLAESVKNVLVPVSLCHLEKWTEERTQHFARIAWGYYRGLDLTSKDQFHNALLHMFVGVTCTVDFEWDFIDLGLIYRSKDVSHIGTQRHILCRPAQKALLELFKRLPLPEATRIRICNGDLEGMDFEVALCHQLICSAKPIKLKATNINGKNSTIISLDFLHCETLRKGDYSLGPEHDNVLIRCYERYPRFDFILGRMFIQVSVSSFAKHDTGSAEIRKAFMVQGGDRRNQIERYLDDAYGHGHHAYIDASTNRFVVTKENGRAPDIRIVYIRGSPGKADHRDLVKKYPDVLHVTFEEVQRSLLKNTLEVGL